MGRPVVREPSPHSWACGPGYTRHGLRRDGRHSPLPIRTVARKSSVVAIHFPGRVACTRFPLQVLKSRVPRSVLHLCVHLPGSGKLGRVIWKSPIWTSVRTNYYRSLRYVGSVVGGVSLLHRSVLDQSQSTPYVGPSPCAKTTSSQHCLQGYGDSHSAHSDGFRHPRSAGSQSRRTHVLPARRVPSHRLVVLLSRCRRS